MDMLTKLQVLSSQLDDPSFVEEFSEGFKEFLEYKSLEKIEEKELFSVRQVMSFNVASVAMMTSYGVEDKTLFVNDDFSCSDLLMGAAA